MYNRGRIMSEEERLEIINWCNDNYDTFEYIPNNNNNINTVNTVKRKNKWIHESMKELPSSIYNIFHRIEQRENIFIDRSKFLNYPDIDSESRSDFICIIPYNSYLHKHVDNNSIKTNTYHVRFNVFISNPKDKCNTYYNGNIVDTTEGTYVLCRSGIDYHWTDVNNNQKPRISLSFVYFLTGEQIDYLCRDPSIGIYNKLYPLSQYNVKLIYDINYNNAFDKFDKKYEEYDEEIIDNFLNLNLDEIFK